MGFNLNLDNVLNVKELVVGRFYLFKDGRLALYMGWSQSNQQYCFYRICSCLYQGVTWHNSEILHYDIIKPCIEEMIKRVLHNPCNMKAISLLKGPKVCAVYSDVEFKDCYKWYLRSCVVDADVANLKLIVPENPSQAKKTYVRAKELVRGQLYVADSGDVYIYLGRDFSKRFCYTYVSGYAGEITLESVIRSICSGYSGIEGIEHLKNSKKLNIPSNPALNKKFDIRQIEQAVGYRMNGISESGGVMVVR